MKRNPAPELPESTERGAREIYKFDYIVWFEKIEALTKEFAGDLKFLRDEPALFFALASNTINELAEFFIWIASHEKYRFAVCPLYENMVLRMIKPIKKVPQIMENVSEIIYSLYDRSCTIGEPMLIKSNKQSPYEALLTKIQENCSAGKESTVKCFEFIYEKVLKKGPLRDKLVQEEFNRLLAFWMDSESPDPAISYILYKRLNPIIEYFKRVKIEFPESIEAMSLYFRSNMNRSELLNFNSEDVRESTKKDCIEKLEKADFANFFELTLCKYLNSVDKYVEGWD